MKDDKTSPKSTDNKIDSVIGTTTYLNRFKNLNKNDKDSSISSEKIDSNIGTSLYLNRFKFTNDNKEDKKKDEIKSIYSKYNKTEGNKDIINLESDKTNKYGYINKFRNKSDNKDDKMTFSYSRFDKINKDEGKSSSNYGSNVGISYSSNLKHTSSYNYIPKIETKNYISNISSLGAQKDKEINIKKYELKSNPLSFDKYKIKQPATFDTYENKSPIVFDTYQDDSYIKKISGEPKSYSKKVEIKTTTTSSLSSGKTGNNNFVYNSNINTDNTKKKYGLRDTLTTGLHKSNTENKMNIPYKSPSLSTFNNNYGHKIETKIERKYETKPYRSNVGSSYDSTKIVTTQFKSRFNP